MSSLILPEIVAQLPGEIAWKDPLFQYMGCNTNRAIAAKLKYPEEIIGCTDNDLSDQTSQSISFHHRHDQMALQGKTIKTIHTSAIANDGLTYYQIKKPLISNGKTEGIIYHTVEFIKHDWFPCLQKFDKNIFPDFFISSFYQIDPDSNYYQFTPRELECLFCLLRGMSAKITANLLGLSKRTVEFYIENMKNKTGSATKMDLIINTIQANYIELVPTRFLSVDITKT